MVKTAVRTAPIFTFALLGIPESAGIARCHVRAALEYNGLGNCADDAAAVASELVSNAVQHATTKDTAMILVALAHIHGPGRVAVAVADALLVIVVMDCSPHPPLKRDPPDFGEHWRGLHVVEALSARWGWTPADSGKAVYAVLPTCGSLDTERKLPMTARFPGSF